MIIFGYSTFMLFFMLTALYMQVSPLSRDMERLRVSSPAARKVPVDPKAAAANRKRRSSKQGNVKN
jgi:hypothetical protein